MATSKDEIDRRRREQMMELLKKGEDPAFVRYAMWREYGDTAAIDKDLQTIQELTGGQPTTPKKVEGITVNGETFTPKTYSEASEYQKEQKKEETGKYQVSTILNEKLKNFEDLLSDTEGLKAATGTNIAGRGVDLPLNIYTDPDRSRFAGGAAQALSNEALQSLIDAKASGATFGALSDQELKMLQQSASKLGQWAIIKDGKITGFNASEKDVKKELKNLKEQTKIALSKVEEKPEAQPTQTQDPQIEQAKQWLQENPNDPRAEKVRAKLGLSKETDFTKTKIGELSVEKAMGTVGTEEVTPTITQEVIKKPSTLSKIANFLGVKKFGEGIGATYFLMSKEGKELQKKAEEGDKFALEALNAILDEAPTSKEVIGSAALTALNAVTLGTASKAKALTLGEKITLGATQGAVYGTASGLEQDKDLAGIAGSAVGGAAVGGVVAGAFAGADKLIKMQQAKRPQKVIDAVGKVLQGSRKDKQAGIRTLSSINPKEIKTYQDLNNKLYERMGVLGDAMDDILSKDTTKRTLSQLDKVSKVGGKEVKTNYIQKALNHLDEFYAKAENPENAQRIKNLLVKAKKEGLSVKEINDIAKEYGMEFGEKAFTKLGEQKTSVTSMAYENIRKGIKTTVRDLLPDDNAKLIDKAFSDAYKTLRLTEKMDETVNKLTQKLQGRGFFEKAGNIAGKITDAITGHALRGALSGVLPSNVGLKTMNSLALQNKLQKNLKIISRGGEGKIIKLIEETAKKTNKPITESVLQKIIIRALED